MRVNYYCCKYCNRVQREPEVTLTGSELPGKCGRNLRAGSGGEEERGSDPPCASADSQGIKRPIGPHGVGGARARVGEVNWAQSM